MLKLYFGNVPCILSTIVFLLFSAYFIITLKKPESEKKWKKAAVISVFIGLLMSALSGIKDSAAEKMAVSFKQMNLPLAVLCILGVSAIISGAAAGFCKNEKVNKAIFFIVSFIIFAKTAIVEILRIANL